MRRLFLALALFAAPLLGITSCTPPEPCRVVHLNQNGNHPPGAAYHANIQTWTTVVGGIIHIYGYSLTIDTVIWNNRACIYENLVDPPRDTPAANVQ